MRFYTQQHQYYCGIDLHARSMYVCIMNREGEIMKHRNMATTADELVKVIEPYRNDVVLAVECIFTWYWIADLCHQIGVKFVLGHALYMKAIHGGKVKNDKIDSQKIAALLRGGMLPMAYVYPQAMRSTRDLLRSIPGIGKTLALVILYEIHDIGRFPKVGNFISYSRLVKCAHESAGKRMKAKNTKIGNVHLKWAFSEAACLFLRGNPRAQLYHHRLLSRYGKAKALSIIAQKLGRTVYTMLKRRTPYDARRFFETVG